MNKVVTAEFQNIMDLSIQECGGIASIFDVALLNGYGISDDPEIGAKLQVPTLKADVAIAMFLKKKGNSIATNYTIDQWQSLFENGLFQYGLFE